MGLHQSDSIRLAFITCDGSSVDYSDFNAQIANKESNIGVMKHYSSKSHIALAYMALTDLVMYGKRNLSICQNCGRYYLQYSGKEVYCDLPNQDGSLDKLLAEANRQLGELNAYSIDDRSKRRTQNTRRI